MVQRGNQRQLVYKSEVFAEAGLPRMTLLECRRFADGVASSRYIRYYFPNSPKKYDLVFTLVNMGDAGASFATGQIILPDWAMTKHTILHEIAHFLVESIGGVAGHCSLFCAILKELIGVFLGRTKQFELKLGFKFYKIDVDTRPIHKILDLPKFDYPRLPVSWYSYIY